jgi:hypothetical protein
MGPAVAKTQRSKTCSPESSARTAATSVPPPGCFRACSSARSADTGRSSEAASRRGPTSRGKRKQSAPPGCSNNSRRDRHRSAPLRSPIIVADGSRAVYFPSGPSRARELERGRHRFRVSGPGTWKLFVSGSGPPESDIFYRPRLRKDVPADGLDGRFVHHPCAAHYVEIRRRFIPIIGEFGAS